jgi:dipeptidyl aminopeptidase/acylaminoacyl peptidase
VAQLAEIRDVRLDLPRWSPDGSAIAAVGAPAAVSGELFFHLWLVRMDDKRLRRLKALVPERGISSGYWRDDRTILYSRGDRATAVTAELVTHDTLRDTVTRVPWRCCALHLDGIKRSTLIFDERANRAGLLEFGRYDHRERWLSHANSPDRQPVFAPDGKSIAFASRRDGSMNLWQISRENGAITRLTENNSTDFDPGFSPSGTQLIFTSDRSGSFEIYLANRDGSGVRQLTRTGSDAENATMTPDAQWVVYASDTPGRSGIWKIRPNGSDGIQILRGLATNPEVSPDGQYILYLVNPQPDVAEIHVMRISDGAQLPEYIRCSRRRQNGVTLGRARWVPSADGKKPIAIVFVDQDVAGSTGISIQDFVPGQNTAATRRQVRRFDPVAPVETLGVSPDGKLLILTIADDTSSIMAASQNFK